MNSARFIVIGLVLHIGAGIDQPRIGDMAPALPTVRSSLVVRAIF